METRHKMPDRQPSKTSKQRPLVSSSQPTSQHDESISMNSLMSSILSSQMSRNPMSTVSVGQAEQGPVVSLSHSVMQKKKNTSVISRNWSENRFLSSTIIPIHSKITRLRKLLHDHRDLQEINHNRKQRPKIHLNFQGIKYHQEGGRLYDNKFDNDAIKLK